MSARFLQWSDVIVMRNNEQNWREKLDIDKKKRGGDDRSLRNSSISIEGRGWHSINHNLTILWFERKLSNHLQSLGIGQKKDNFARRFLCQTIFDMAKAVSLPASKA